MSTDTLTPELRPLDVRVLDAIPSEGASQRAEAVALAVCGKADAPATPEQFCEVREILRGLERIGMASQRGGWWRRV